MTGGIFCSPVIENVTCHLLNPPVTITGKTGPAQRPEQGGMIDLFIDFTLLHHTWIFSLNNSHQLLDSHVFMRL